MTDPQDADRGPVPASGRATGLRSPSDASVTWAERREQAAWRRAFTTVTATAVLGLAGVVALVAGVTERSWPEAAGGALLVSAGPCLVLALRAHRRRIARIAGADRPAPAVSRPRDYAAEAVWLVAGLAAVALAAVLLAAS